MGYCYNFRIRECENGWLLERSATHTGEFFPTLNALTEEILRYVDDAIPAHRNTGVKAAKRIKELSE